LTIDLFASNKEARAMAQQKKLENDLAGIAAEKAKLKRNWPLAEREKATREAAPTREGFPAGRSGAGEDPGDGPG
jgi:hypothetical protein